MNSTCRCSGCAMRHPLTGACCGVYRPNQPIPTNPQPIEQLEIFGSPAPAPGAGAVEAIAAIFGLAGAWLLATKGQHAAWGWWAFLASNAGWLVFGWIRRHWFLLLQQVGFTASSLWGIWTWMYGG